PLVSNGIFLNYGPLKDIIMIKLKDRIIRINDEQDVIDLSSKLTAQGQDLLVYPIGHIYDPRMMIKYGFLPFTLDSDGVSKDMVDYINGMDDNTFIFWYSNIELHTIKRILADARWKFFTLETHIRNGVTKAYSLPLLIYKDSYVYSDTKRPKTDMAIFRQPASLTKTSLKSIPPTSGPGIARVIPVTRYSEGMSKGLYQKESKVGEYCGTFYYH